METTHVRSKNIIYKNTTGMNIDNESEYTKQARDFLKSNNIKLTIKMTGRGHYFEGDTDTRDIYEFELFNMDTDEYYVGTFGTSIADTEKYKRPCAYSILSSLWIDYSESFEDFCMEYGYDSDRISHKKIYDATQKQNEGLQRVLNPKQIDELHDLN